MSLYKYRVLEMLNPRFLFTSVSPLLPPQSGPSFKSWTKGTSVICVGLGPEFDTLLMQHMATGHWMQLTGLDKFLAHETQFTGGWSMWRPSRIRNLGRRQEHWGADLGQWSREQGPDPTKWLSTCCRSLMSCQSCSYQLDQLLHGQACHGGTCRLDLLKNVGHLGPKKERERGFMLYPWGISMKPPLF